jgi:hypothetical protein
MIPNVIKASEMPFTTKERNAMGNLIIKEWEAVGFKWRIERYRYGSWFYLFRNDRMVEEAPDKTVLLEHGWYQ